MSETLKVPNESALERSRISGTFSSRRLSSEPRLQQPNPVSTPSCLKSTTGTFLQFPDPSRAAACHNEGS
ncbi:hypothetical protein CCH79_00017882 [Gambusia affinis]|uniref:Uncharacterized protein n=1 Tax=Gambusia affinis TaxID=33528 RepID=A0A315UZQ4_GAMAF|nr:hypothetical protein CCH79_00017882 [Gambusia affinis]